jgi:hypothetical protein
MNLRILNAFTEIYDLNRPRLDTVDYLAEHGIDINAVAGFCGSPTILPITLLPNRRFDLPNHNDEIVAGCVIEARAADGESVIDLVAWPVADPADIRTLCGVAPMAGLWSALNPGTYTFNYPLVVYRSPLAWLKADCNGAAVVIPRLAAQTLLDITDMGGRIGAQDAAHAHELRMILHALVDQVKIVIPKMRVAA